MSDTSIVQLSKQKTVTYRQRRTLATKTQFWVSDTEYIEHIENLLLDTYDATGSREAAKNAVTHDIYTNAQNYALTKKTAQLAATVAYNNVFGTHFQNYSSCYN